MDHPPGIGFNSYDRLFPSQDTMPAGGFGNSIPLPQNRSRQNGNNVFLDDDPRLYDDQWACLSTIARLSQSELLSIVAKAASEGEILGMPLLSTEEGEEPWAIPPARRNEELLIVGPLPCKIDAIMGNQVYIERTELPPVVVNRLARLAAFQNPELYAAQAVRLSWQPRIISCAKLFPKHVALPRGCLDDTLRLLSRAGIASSSGTRTNRERRLGRGSLDS
jgi:hypothetical protein